MSNIENLEEHEVKKYLMQVLEVFATKGVKSNTVFNTLATAFLCYLDAMEVSKERKIEILNKFANEILVRL